MAIYTDNLDPFGDGSLIHSWKLDDDALQLQDQFDPTNTWSATSGSLVFPVTGKFAEGLEVPPNSTIENAVGGTGVAKGADFTLIFWVKTGIIDSTIIDEQFCKFTLGGEGVRNNIDVTFMNLLSNSTGVDRIWGRFHYSKGNYLGQSEIKKSQSYMFGMMSDSVLNYISGFQGPYSYSYDDAIAIDHTNPIELIGLDQSGVMIDQIMVFDRPLTYAERMLLNDTMTQPSAPVEILPDPMTSAISVPNVAVNEFPAYVFPVPFVGTIDIFVPYIDEGVELVHPTPASGSLNINDITFIYYDDFRKIEKVRLVQDISKTYSFKRFRIVQEIQHQKNAIMIKRVTN